MNDFVDALHFLDPSSPLTPYVVTVALFLAVFYALGSRALAMLERILRDRGGRK